MVDRDIGWDEKVVPFRCPPPSSGSGSGLGPMHATPFAWRPEIDLPRRDWVYGRHLLRNQVSVDVAAGGVGKTALKVGEALAMASGKAILGVHVGEPLRVWLFNLEDDNDELELRVRAAMKYHRLTPEDIEGRLFVDSGFDQPCIIARQQATGTIIAEPVVNGLVTAMRARAIDVLIVDPFVSSHEVNENDNVAIDTVVKKGFIVVARDSCAAINIVHHIRKSNGEEATADSARGASALISAARSVQVLNRMTLDEAERAQVDPAKHKYYFRVTNGKANMAPQPERAEWYRMNSVDLDNGEAVGACASWLWPTPEALNETQVAACQRAVADGEWRNDPRAKAWVGHAIAGPLGIDDQSKEGRDELKRHIENMIASKALEVDTRRDDQRHVRQYVVVGTRGFASASVQKPQPTQTDADDE